ncbi:hypothetical protein VTK73DRAFT_9334 [Phialemonium thermophilum]|uniref:N-acetyltransferase domain-containing protein n=1 Tax=Phialemonium thermophilum TaxID=223376 RepID=A0ABR3XKV6_9PEZI
METQSTKQPRLQQSIKSFFQPRQPAYTVPPSLLPTTGNPAPDASKSQPIPTPPPPPAAATATRNGTAVARDAVSVVNTSAPIPPPPPSLPPQASIVPVLEHHIPALRRINALLLPVTYPDNFYARILSPAQSGLFSRVILWQERGDPEPKVIGGLVCRLEDSPFVDAAGNPKSLNTRQPTPQPPSVPRQTATNGTPTTASNGTPATATRADLNSQSQRQQQQERQGPRYHAIYIQSLALLSPYRGLGLAAATLENIAESAALLRLAPQPGGINVTTIYAHVWTENEEGLRWYASRGFSRDGAEPVRGYYFKLRPDTAWVVRREVVPPADTATPSTSAAVSGVTAAAAGLLSPAGQRGLVEAQPLAQAVPAAPPPPVHTPSPAPSLSYQKTRPETEWNDLPPDMMSGTPGPPGRGSHLSAPVSESSSRSSSKGRKKKERAYPAAAFGN